MDELFISNFYSVFAPVRIIPLLVPINTGVATLGIIVFSILIIFVLFCNCLRLFRFASIILFRIFLFEVFRPLPYAEVL